MTTYFAGFSLGLSLILAIGSQNAFVLKQGLKNQHVLVICTVCAVSDALPISFGVTGFGAIVQQFPQIELIARYGGAMFLGVYSFLSFRSAFTENHALEANGQANDSLIKAVAMCLAFTWLNPQVYLVPFLLNINLIRCYLDLERYRLLLCSSFLLALVRVSWLRCLRTREPGRYWNLLWV